MYLYEEELWLPDQTFALIPSEQRGHGLNGYGAIGAIDHALFAVAQQNAGKTRAVAVVFLWGWKRAVNF